MLHLLIEHWKRAVKPETSESIGEVDEYKEITSLFSILDVEVKILKLKRNKIKKNRKVEYFKWNTSINIKKKKILKILKYKISVLSQILGKYVVVLKF